MSMRKNRKALCAAKLAVPLVAAGLLAACSSTRPVAFEDTYTPQLGYKRYPINVAKGTVKLDVSTASARLTAAQEDAVTRFAQQAHNSATGYVVVRRPGGNVNASGQLRPCLQCDEDNSGPGFKYSAGRTRRNSGIESAIPRADSELYPVDHSAYFH